MTTEESGTAVMQDIYSFGAFNWLWQLWVFERVGRDACSRGPHFELIAIYREKPPRDVLNTYKTERSYATSWRGHFYKWGSPVRLPAEHSLYWMTVSHVYNSSHWRPHVQSDPGPCLDRSPSSPGVSIHSKLQVGARAAARQGSCVWPSVQVRGQETGWNWVTWLPLLNCCYCWLSFSPKLTHMDKPPPNNHRTDIPLLFLSSVCVN